MSNRGRVQPVADTGSAQTEAQTAAGAQKPRICQLLRQVTSVCTWTVLLVETD